MNNVMKEYLKLEQKNEILKYGNNFFEAEENRSAFAKYFSCLAAASLLSHN